MPDNGNAWQRSLRAAESAGRLLDELEIDQTHQVDVFSICENLDLWLAFMPMDGLLGAFLPEGTGGILITDRRQVTVQRFTAAHELGHWRLEHGRSLSLDSEEQVLGANPGERERLAQVFASNLLMPPTLVLSLAERIGIGDQDPIRPDQAYFVARESGVSYEAAVRQLTNMQIITPADATSLLRIRPLDIKSQLAGGRRPIYGYADVWPVDELWNDQSVSVRIEDEIVISLPENQSTGYRWMFHDEVGEVVTMPEPPRIVTTRANSIDSGAIEHFLETAKEEISSRAPTHAIERVKRFDDTSSAKPFERNMHGTAEVVGDAYLAGRGLNLSPRDSRKVRLANVSGATSENIKTPGGTGAQHGEIASLKDELRIAATGRRLLGIRFPESGSKILRLQYRSPFHSAPPAEEYVLRAEVEQRREGFSLDQLVEDSGQTWVDEVRERRSHSPMPITEELNHD
jgi:IrrE N-terminal-like domain